MKNKIFFYKQNQKLEPSSMKIFKKKRNIVANMESVPNEILAHILQFCQTKTLAKMAVTSARNNGLMNYVGSKSNVLKRELKSEDIIQKWTQARLVQIDTKAFACELFYRAWKLSETKILVVGSTANVQKFTVAKINEKTNTLEQEHVLHFL